MKQLKILIIHNKPPYVHDLFTEQTVNICDKLSETENLEVIWLVFPTDVQNIFEKKNFNLINADEHGSTLKLIKKINPEIVIINGSMDFHNLRCCLIAKHLKIPLAIVFFRNLLSAEPLSKLGVFRTRMRTVFIKDKSIKTKNSALRLIPFYVKQYQFLYKTFFEINQNKWKSIKFILNHMKSISSSYTPIKPIMQGDVNLCIGEAWKKELITSGFNEKTIQMTGDTYFDKVYNDLKNIKIKKNKDKKINILFCTSTMFNHGMCLRDQEFELIINTCNEILKDEKFELSIKIHPSTTNIDEYEKSVITKLDKKVRLFQKENLLELMTLSDVIVTYGGSGAIRYAALLGKPIINLNFGTAPTGNNVFLDKKIIMQCKKLEELNHIINENKNRKSSEEETKDFITQYLGDFDGKSSERGAKAIMNLINNGIET